MVLNAPRIAAGLAVQALARCFSSACGGGGDDDPPPPPPPPPPAADTTAPTIPAGVTATAQTPTQILVSWTASTDAGTGVARLSRVSRRQHHRRSPRCTTH